MTAAAAPLVREGTFHAGPFVTDGGGIVPDLRLHHRIYGDPATGRRRGWIVVFHALTGSAAVDQWWAPLLVPGMPLDPARHPVLAVNLPGSCYGSSGPAGDPGFPEVTPGDMARAHDALLAHLGVERVTLAIGGSLGGMVALEFGRRAPVEIERLVVIGAPAATSAQAIAWNAAQRLAIEADPVRGLAAARAIAMITYRAPAELAARFGRETTRSPDRFDVDHYLRRQGEKLVERFDAASYLTLMRAMDLHDLGDLALAARDTAARVGRVTAVGIDSDILYPATEVRTWAEAYDRALPTAYREIRSISGHDAFLIEFDQLARILAEA